MATQGGAQFAPQFAPQAAPGSPQLPPPVAIPAQAVPPSQLPPVDPQAALSMRGLVKIFGQNVAVAGLSLDIPAGSFYGVVGPNGAGKTTTLNMATGLLQPDGGVVTVHGVDVWGRPEEAKRKLGVLPDGMRLFDRLSGRDLITYVGRLRGMPPHLIAERTEQLLRVLGLEEAAGKQVGDYSAGMTKKVSLACALVHSPDVLVLDEPFEAVDPVSAAGIRTMLQHFTAQGGTVVLSSHVMATVEALCTHVAIVHRGQIMAAGTTADVAAGMSLDDRFASLVGGNGKQEELTWLRPSSN